MATAADILVKQARARVRVDRLKEGQVKVCTCIVSHEVEQSPHVDSTSTIHSSSLCTVYFNSLLSGLAYCLHWSIACISELSAIRCIMQQRIVCNTLYYAVAYCLQYAVLCSSLLYATRCFMQQPIVCNTLHYAIRCNMQQPIVFGSPSGEASEVEGARRPGIVYHKLLSGIFDNAELESSIVCSSILPAQYCLHYSILLSTAAYLGEATKGEDTRRPPRGGEYWRKKASRQPLYNTIVRLCIVCKYHVVCGSLSFCMSCCLQQPVVCSSLLSAVSSLLPQAGYCTL